MKMIDINYKLISDDTKVLHDTMEVEDWWTDYYIIDFFWNKMGRYNINKTSIRIIRPDSVNKE